MASRPVSPGFWRGRFFLHTRLGAGGMGEVWLAREGRGRGCGATVVIKQLLPHLARDARYVELLRREAAFTATLHHPNIVRVLGLEEVDGTLLLVMEHVPCCTLQQLAEAARLAGEALPPALGAFVLSCVCEALEYAYARSAHGEGGRVMIHGDISPSNLLVAPEGGVKVLDFGLSRPEGECAPLAATRPFAAPELLASGPVDRRADVYALGAVLLALLEHPSRAPELWALGQWASTSRPHLRPASAADFQGELETFLAREPFGPRQLGRLWRRLASPRTEPETGASTTGVLERGAGGSAHVEAEPANQPVKPGPVDARGARRR
ncbi:serine/threonine-protein kinase [Archangium violaceum]|uniref:serine/threonine-protein kinase n=1 Tax=Archangium violaceum TaxID=83451 RepID=UPI0036D7C97A